jgi:hypothetical protein
MSQQPIENKSRVTTFTQPHFITRKQYITPILCQYGALSRLTQGGASGAAEAMSSSPNKKA